MSPINESAKDKKENKIKKVKICANLHNKNGFWVLNKQVSENEFKEIKKILEE